MTSDSTPPPADAPPPDPATTEVATPAAPAAIAHPRTVRSFVRRAGRTTVGQTRALAELGPRLLLPYQPEAIDLIANFLDSTGDSGRFDPKNPGPIVLEIGFGMGEATAHIAALLPDTRFLCCEVHEPGIGALLKRISEQGLGNIRIVAHDAVEVIDHMLTPGCLDGVHIFFPDPWHKTRHHKRRLIQPALVARLADRLKPGGYLHCATDWQPYAQQMLGVLGQEPLLRNRYPEGAEGIEPGYAPRPHYRPQTKFERRGLRLGHGVWDLVFERI